MSGKLIDEKLWKAIKEKWEYMHFDPTLLTPVEFWSEQRGESPLETFLTVAQRALVRGIDL